MSSSSHQPKNPPPTVKQQQQQTPSAPDDILVTLKNALQKLSTVNVTSEDALFVELVEMISSVVSLNLHTQRETVCALETYNRLVQLARNSTTFDEVVSAAKTHVVKSFRTWSKVEYEQPNDFRSATLYIVI